MDLSKADQVASIAGAIAGWTALTLTIWWRRKDSRVPTRTPVPPEEARSRRWKALLRAGLLALIPLAIVLSFMSVVQFH